MRHRMMILPVLLVVLLTCMTGWAFAEKKWVSIDGTTVPAGPKITVITSNETETILRFDIPGFWVEEITEGVQTFHVLRFPGYGTTLEIGKPELPVISELVAIPATTGIISHIVEHEETVLDGYLIYPFQKPLREGEERISFEIDHDFYNQVGMYPKTVEVGKPAIWRDLRVTNIRVAPMRYVPSKKTLNVCKSVTVRLEYTGESDTNRKDRQIGPIKKHYDEMYSRNVINYEYLNVPLLEDTDEETIDILIITQHGFMSYVEPLVTWKEEQGYTVYVAPNIEIGSNDVDNIKAYIQNKYTENGISYVLFVGSDYYYPGYEGYGFFSDYYYTLLEGDDDFPEIGIGRFPAMNGTEVSIMVNKSVTYESSPPFGDWLRNVLLVAHCQMAPDWYQGCKESIRLAEYTPSGTYSVLYPDFITAYGAKINVGGDRATNEDVIDYINEGVRVVNYRGHGNSISWLDWNINYEEFQAADVDQINNGNMTPVVFSTACWNGNVLYDGGLCIGEYWVLQPDAAVAYYGASYPSFTYVNNYYDISFFAKIFDEGVTTVSDATNEACVNGILGFGDLGLDNARMYIWLGDPTLHIIYDDIEPPAPELISPVPGEIFDEPAQPTFDWSDEVLADYYRVQIDNDPDFINLIYDDTCSVSELNSPVLSGGTYYWRVQSMKYAIPGFWSNPNHFSVGVPFEAPALIFPYDNSKIKASGSITLEWQGVENCSRYYVQVDNDAAFSSPHIYEFCSGYEFEFSVKGMDLDTYYWRVRCDCEGWPWSDARTFKLTEPGKTIPDPDPQLTANFPNPFNPSTTISFELPKTGHVKLEVFNVNGALITTLVDEVRESGRHDVLWNGKDAKGVSVASGIYFYRLKAGAEVVTKKMMLLR